MLVFAVGIKVVVTSTNCNLQILKEGVITVCKEWFIFGIEMKLDFNQPCYMCGEWRNGDFGFGFTTLN